MLGTQYNRIAGGSLERIAALSDGLFAIAMTLLVLDLRAPAAEAIHSDRVLLAALLDQAPRLLMFLMSFLTLGIFWVGQQTQLNHLSRGDRHLSWLHLMFLFAVSLMPFSTSLVAEFSALRVAVVVYWLNILLLGLLLLASWRYAQSHALVKMDAPGGLSAAVERRILIAQGLYALGAALCTYSTMLSLGFIFLVQINYVVAPRWGVLGRI